MRSKKVVQHFLRMLQCRYWPYYVDQVLAISWLIHIIYSFFASVMILFSVSGTWPHVALHESDPSRLNAEWRGAQASDQDSGWSRNLYWERTKSEWCIPDVFPRLCSSFLKSERITLMMSLWGHRCNHSLGSGQKAGMWNMWSLNSRQGGRMRDCTEPHCGKCRTQSS